MNEGRKGVKPMKIFASRLRQLRQERKLRQKDMAEKLGITESAYGYYEQGRREPPYETLQQLADFFGVSIDYLLGRVDNPTKTEDDLKKALEAIPDLSKPHDKNVAMEKIKELLKIKRLTIDDEPIPEEQQDLLIAQFEAIIATLKKQQESK